MLCSDVAAPRSRSKATELWCRYFATEQLYRTGPTIASQHAFLTGPYTDSLQIQRLNSPTGHSLTFPQKQQEQLLGVLMPGSCQLCGKRVSEVFECPMCRAMLYCSEKHAKSHLAMGHDEECGRMQVQMLRAQVRPVPIVSLASA